VKKETKTWLKIAEEDYDGAEYLWKGHRYSGAVLFFQQAVEKIIKAYIIEVKHTMPRKTHDIEDLIKTAGLDLSEIQNPDVDELTKAFSRVRYPDLSKKHYEKRSDVDLLVKMARAIYLWISKKLKNH
jgi:HEPN domain-containing protein